MLTWDEEEHRLRDHLRAAALRRFDRMWAAGPPSPPPPRDDISMLPGGTSTVVVAEEAGDETDRARAERTLMRAKHVAPILRRLRAAAARDLELLRVEAAWLTDTRARARRLRRDIDATGRTADRPTRGRRSCPRCRGPAASGARTRLTPRRPRLRGGADGAGGLVASARAIWLRRARGPSPGARSCGPSCGAWPWRSGGGCGASARRCCSRSKRGHKIWEVTQANKTKRNRA